MKLVSIYSSDLTFDTKIIENEIIKPSFIQVRMLILSQSSPSELSPCDQLLTGKRFIIYAWENCNYTDC